MKQIEEAYRAEGFNFSKLCEIVGQENSEKVEKFLLSIKPKHDDQSPDYYLDYHG